LPESRSGNSCRFNPNDMKIFKVEQIRELDKFTIENEPIPSIELMERASRAFVKWFMKIVPSAKGRIHIFCGPGNNGGDGLAIARMLSWEFYEVTAYVLHIGHHFSEDFTNNLRNLKKHRSRIIEIRDGDPLPELPADDVLIDAIFGSGLSRPPAGYWAELINHLNAQPVERVAVDIPSGLFADKPTTGLSIHARHTFSFEMPKLGFLFPENCDRVGEWDFGSIGLHPDFIKKEKTPWHLLDFGEVSPLLHNRRKYDHKGTFGHALLVAGGYGKVGAAILAAKACLRSGAGLITVHAPKCAYEILQISFPEAMVSVDEHEYSISSIQENLNRYSAIGTGCGIGTSKLAMYAIEELLEKTQVPVVLDADALNLLAGNPALLKKIPRDSILTPHPKEFERMFGKTKDSFECNSLQREKASDLGIYLFLKGANTSVACPGGDCYFNSTGNPGMATGGSGDVLTGILTGLLTQGYSSHDASLLGVFLHGLAGDLAAGDLQHEALLASDIIRYLGKAFKKLRDYES
jgi:ADP-dependent NAD(P)H-hydrate dehydratase / NAD(P)H-hydrate epimerase